MKYEYGNLEFPEGSIREQILQVPRLMFKYRRIVNVIKHRTPAHYTHEGIGRGCTAALMWFIDDEGELVNISELS